jgi:cytoskeleton protein RodZ
VLRFRAEGRSWVEVRDASGTVVFSRILDAGQEASLDGTPPFSLVVGNAAVVRVEFRGEPIEIKEVSKNGVGRIRLP